MNGHAIPQWIAALAVGLASLAAGCELTSEDDDAAIAGEAGLDGDVDGDAGDAEPATDADVGADTLCEGPDEDEDGVPDACDVCPGRDDEADGDADGYPCNRDCNDDDRDINPDAEELCDGVDNDCSGTPDDVLEGAPAANQNGVCAGAQQRCDAGVWVEPDYAAIPAYEAVETLCDGLDNDCDGVADVGLVAPAADRTDGVCAGSTKRCDGLDGWGEPDYLDLDGFEEDETSCDGLDNDCDGEVDESADAPLAARQDGVCAGAVSVCDPAGGWSEPDYAAIDGYEDDESLCDGLDNDCDGEVDEALMPPPARLQMGVCAGAVQVCAGQPGWVEPNYADFAGYEAEEQSCDGADNDCDGETDDAFNIGGACAALGACGAGILECAGADAARCSTAPGGSADASAPERCDRLDNDCDGEVDEDVLCPPAGAVDPRFGVDGIVVLDLGAEAEAFAVSVDGDGRPVIAGEIRPAGGELDFLVARLDAAAGALDAEFGAGGWFAHDFDGRTDRAFALALGEDGAPLVVGYGGAPAGARPAALRLTAAGALDAGFANGGDLLVAAAPSGSWRGVVTLGGGGFAAAGDVRAAGGDAVGYLTRHAAGGAIETTALFPAAGGEDIHVRGLSSGDGGALYLGGHTERGYDDDELLLRVGVDGAVLGTTEADRTAGRGDGTPGHVADSRDRMLAVAVDAQGRVVTAGASGGDMVVARHGADGQPDPAFGGGHVTVDFDGGRDVAHAVAVQPDGAVLVAGRAEVAGVYRLAVARLTADGAPDATFGVGGRVTFEIAAGADAVANGVALDPAEATVVVAGRVGVGAARRAVVVRFFR